MTTDTKSAHQKNRKSTHGMAGSANHRHRPLCRTAIMAALAVGFAGGSPAAWASSAFYASVNSVATPQAGTAACQAARQSALNQCQSVYQQQTQNMQQNMQQPGGLASQSCLGSLLSTSTGMFSNIQSLASGGGIAGLLSSLGNTMMQQFGSAVCAAAGNAWNGVSSQIDQVANLPTTLGQAAAGQAMQLGQTAGNEVTAPISNGSVPQVIPYAPLGNVPSAPLAPSSGSGNNVTTLGGLL